MGRTRCEKVPFRGGQRGISLLEVLLGVAVLSAIGVVFFYTMFNVSRAAGQNMESTAVDSLASSQIEYLESQTYILVASYNATDPAFSYETIDVPSDMQASGYSVEIISPVVIISKVEGGHELQEVGVVVKRNGQQQHKVSVYRTGG